ncbi:MAG TPA: hypothetical protein VFM14_03455 [Gemmatimonadales bacterium]|nr:hypothetical protein [Gemmatimonadales bacterium]
MRRCTRSAGFVVATTIVMGFSLGEAVPAEAQGNWSAADEAALKGYTLTMDKVRRATQVMIEFDRLEESRPDLADDDEEIKSIDQMVSRINAVPEAKAALTKHGVTTRDYVLTLLTSTHAGAAAFMEENGQPVAGIPVSKAQTEFYKAHKAEIDQLNAQRKAASDSEDSEDSEE